VYLIHYDKIQIQATMSVASVFVRAGEFLYPPTNLPQLLVADSFTDV
jgi:hypothetical protein